MRFECKRTFRGISYFEISHGYPVGLYTSFQWAPLSILNNLLYWIGTIPWKYDIKCGAYCDYVCTVILILWSKKFKVGNIYKEDIFIFFLFKTNDYRFLWNSRISLTKFLYFWFIFSRNKNVMCQYKDYTRFYMWWDVILIDKMYGKIFKSIALSL